MTIALKMLKEKSAELKGLFAELETLKKAETNAREQMREAQEGLQEFESLSSEITKWRANQVKADNDPRKLPESLQKKQVAKEKAAEEFSLAQGTLETINDDLTTTKWNLEQIKEGLREHAIRALEAHAESIADELIEFELRVEDLKQMLSGLRALNFVKNGYRYNAGDTDKIKRALFLGGRQYPMNVDPVATMKGRWEAKLQALIMNPDAPLDDLKPVLPDDYKG